MGDIFSLLGLAGKLLSWILRLLGLGGKSEIRKAHDRLEDAQESQAETEEELHKVKAEAKAEKERSEDIENIDEFFSRTK